MNIIIPLGGVGSRFTVEGYTRPKPLIRVLGKEMIRWVLDSLDLQPADQVQLRPAHKTWALTCQPGSNPTHTQGWGLVGSRTSAHAQRVPLWRRKDHTRAFGDNPEGFHASPG
jgi:hypothetical protein